MHMPSHDKSLSKTFCTKIWCIPCHKLQIAVTCNPETYFREDMISWISKALKCGFVFNFRKLSSTLRFEIPVLEWHQFPDFTKKDGSNSSFSYADMSARTRIVGDPISDCTIFEMLCLTDLYSIRDSWTDRPNCLAQTWTDIRKQSISF